MKARRTGGVARRLGLAAAAAAAAAAFLPAALAAPPSNDMFAAAQTLAGEQGSTTGSNVEASREANEPDHDGEDGGRSVWFRWTAPADGPVLFETCGSSFDTLLAAYVGPVVASLTAVASNDDSCSDSSRISFPATAGTTYAIAVDGYEGETGTFVLAWRRLSPPANDAFTSPQPLSGASGRVSASSLGSTLEPGEPRHADGAGGSVWFAWTAPATGIANVETCGSAFDTTLAVYTGEAVATLARVAQNDDACRGGGSRVRLDARAGRTYRIAVGGSSSGDAGDVVLSWIVAAPPSNARPSAARAVRGVRGAVTASNVGAPFDAEAADESPVWFRWRAPRSMAITFDTCTNPTLDTQIRVYRSASRRTSALVDSSDDACAEIASRVAFLAERNVEYLIAVGGFRGAWGTFTLTWRPSRSSDGTCLVPDVRGLTVERARTVLAARDCRLGRVVRRKSSIVPRGRIAAQFPTPDRRLPLFARVNVEVSG